jgi:hypothetical protein
VTLFAWHCVCLEGCGIRLGVVCATSRVRVVYAKAAHSTTFKHTLCQDGCGMRLGVVCATKDAGYFLAQCVLEGCGMRLGVVCATKDEGYCLAQCVVGRLSTDVMCLIDQLMSPATDGVMLCADRCCLGPTTDVAIALLCSKLVQVVSQAACTTQFRVAAEGWMVQGCLLWCCMLCCRCVPAPGSPEG